MGVSAAEMALSLQQQSSAPPDWLVMELSSYWIEAADRIRPRIGIWTTLTRIIWNGTAPSGPIGRSSAACSNGPTRPSSTPMIPTCASAGAGTAASGSRESAQPDGLPADLWIDAEGWVREPAQRLFRADACCRGPTTVRTCCW